MGQHPKTLVLVVYMYGITVSFEYRNVSDSDSDSDPVVSSDSGFMGSNSISYMYVHLSTLYRTCTVVALERGPCDGSRGRRGELGHRRQRHAYSYTAGRAGDRPAPPPRVAGSVGCSPSVCGGDCRGWGLWVGWGMVL
eukprot:COSAG02_NODE_284_length_25691_cov_14.733354_17_plen_138_part_00